MKQSDLGPCTVCLSLFGKQLVIANRKTLIRLLLQNQSKLGLHCLSRPFLQATSNSKQEDPDQAASSEIV